jgi:hypothetical protein
LLIAGIAVLVIVLAGVALAVFVVKIPAMTPSGALAQYLSAIENGDLTQADRLVPALSGSQHPVGGTALADRADRITDVTTSIVSTSGSTASGRVSFELSGHRYRATLTLAAGAPQLAFLPDWRVTSPLTTTISLKVPSGGTAIVNGVEAPLDAKLRVTVYPGRYAAGLAPDNTWFTSPTKTVDAATSPVSVTADIAPTAALGDEVTKQVKAAIDACIATNILVPPGCPFSDPIDGTVTGFTWHLDSYPTISFLDATHFFLQSGQARANYVFSHEYIYNKQESDPVPITGPGSVSFSGSQAVIAFG